MRLEKRFWATTDVRVRLAVIHDATAELRRLRAAAKKAEQRNAAMDSTRATSNGQVMARASEASGLTADELRATLGCGKEPHAAIKDAVHAEIVKGATVKAVACEVGISRNVIYDWRKER